MFAEPEWKTLPWHEIPKTPKDTLVDVYVEIPGLFEISDKIREDPQEHSRGKLIHHFVSKCWQIRYELQRWYITTGSSIESLIGKIMAEGDRTASVEHMASAQLLVLYWCCLLHYSQLRQEAFESENVGMQAQIPVAEEDPQTTCRNILRVMVLFLNPCSGWFGINIAALPMVVVSNHIQGLESIDATCREREILCKLLQTPKGKVLSGFVQSIRRIR